MAEAVMQVGRCRFRACRVGVDGSCPQGTPDVAGPPLRDSFAEYTIVKHVALDLTDATTKDWHQIVWRGGHS